jgi:hypothetical protein
MVVTSRLFASLVVITAASALVARPAVAARPPSVTPDGAVYTFGTGPAGEVVMSADSGDLHIEKSVASDGTSALTLRSGDDELRFEVTQGRVAVSGKDGRASFVPDGTDENGQAAVRVALARSKAVQVFRAFAAQVNARGTKGAFELAVSLSGAVIAQVSGDPGALRDFAKRHRPAGRVRAVAFGRITDCWGQYEQYISWAFDQYLYCLGDSGGKLYFHSVTWCEIQYLTRAESAWFQFLSCSAVPVV